MTNPSDRQAEVGSHRHEYRCEVCGRRLAGGVARVAHFFTWVTMGGFFAILLLLIAWGIVELVQAIFT